MEAIKWNDVILGGDLNLIIKHVEVWDDSDGMD
jgi:hypothetical protein